MGIFLFNSVLRKNFLISVHGYEQDIALDAISDILVTSD